MRLTPCASAAVAALGLALAGCGHGAPRRFVERRVPPNDVGPAPADVAPAAPAPAAPAAAPTPAPPAEPRSLDDLVERALARDPEARAAWHDARAAAAIAGSRRSAWYPRLDAAADVGRGNASGSGRTTAGVAASLSWLLLDLGARGAVIDEADQLLLAARLARRAAVLDLVLDVQETYYQYLGARALFAAQQASVKQAETALAAAEDRRRAGVATIADVLQARTAHSQARLRLQSAEGQALAFRGALATLAALPPTTALEVGELPERVAREAAEPEVERLLAEASARNPDLARARALAGASGARARAAARSGLPTLSFDAGAGRGWLIRPDGGSDESWRLGLTVRFPLFEGFRTVYDSLAARESADAAGARADATGQRVMLDVWTSHQALRTAGRRVETSRDLLESASLSAEVATARYKEGVGSILDLLTAQAALEDARAEDVRARADWLVAFARLARSTGRLDDVSNHDDGEAR
jgi:outer membrane protein